MNNVNIKLILSPDKIKPEINFNGVIGQYSVVHKLQFFLASHNFQTPFPTMLFTGSHGLGKTHVARKLAGSLHRRFVEVNCATIATTEDFVEGLLINKVSGEEPVTILLDEAHRLTGDVTTLLLTLLSTDNETKHILSYKNMNLEYDMSRINVILATTDAFRVFPALLNRCERIYFEPYPNNDLFNMLEFYLPEIKVECNKADISFACRGRGRDTFKLAQNVLRYCQMNDTKILNETGWNFIKRIFEIFPCGLNRQEVDLLKIISEYGPISGSNIAMQMMVQEENIENELEVRCRELALIKNTQKGRILTEEGKIYLKNVK